MLTGKTVGVFILRQQQHFDVHRLSQQHIGSSQRSMLTGLITVVQQDDVRRKTMKQTNLINAQSRSRVGNDILDTTLMHRHHIGIAFHHIHAVFLGNGFLRLEESIQFAFLMIDIRIGRVDIFLRNALGAGIQQSSAKRRHLSADAKPRENHTTAITVNKRSSPLPLPVRAGSR